MHIDLPQDLIERVQHHVAILPGANEADVIRKALDSLDWQNGERQAIQEGIVAMNEGQVQDFEQFDREFRQEHLIRRISRPQTASSSPKWEAFLAMVGMPICAMNGRFAS